MNNFFFSSVSHLFLICFLGLSGCTTTKPLPASGAHLFRLEAQGPRIEFAQVTLDSKTEFYEKDELSHESVRKLKIKVRSEIIPIPDVKEAFWIKNTTLEKEGNQELHPFGFPELGESIFIKVNSLGRVIEVQGMEEKTIFHLPPVLLPQHKVSVGESWEETFRWKGEGQPTLLKTTLRCTLKGEELWEDKQVFRIALTATSTLDQKAEDLKIDSLSEGYFLWDNISGIVLLAESLGRDTVEFRSKHQKFETETHYRSVYLPSEKDNPQKN